ncbi:hypothetical protein [Bacillus massiliglaciei]|uniref:hypothetical protein n=1 Tax=Bacillus massiliglaciei TaxID=1816693 RepID=UPI000DA5EC55|nr:hypothetical protein [Bacillus massiliglaciei]
MNIYENHGVIINKLKENYKDQIAIMDLLDEKENLFLLPKLQKLQEEADELRKVSSYFNT